MTDKEAVECAEKLKNFCAKRFEHGTCMDDLYKNCPFYDRSKYTKCSLAQCVDPFEWEIKKEG